MMNVKTNTKGISFMDTNHSKSANYLQPYVSARVSADGAGLL